jgi:hypothetical protein
MRAFQLAAVAIGVVACGSDMCITTPCPFQGFAMNVTVVSSATHAPINGVTVVVNGDASHAVTCNATCAIGQAGGTYTLRFSAPGFQSLERTVIVSSSTSYPNVSGPDGYEGKSCGCTHVDTQNIEAALVSIG